MTARGPALLALGWVLSACAGARVSSPTATSGSEGYVVYVASEAADQISRIRFADGVARVEEQQQVGTMPTEIDGPHGLALSPDGDFYYVTIAHGTPYGTLWKVSTRTKAVEGRVTLGLFPATIGLTPDGRYAFVSNFNLHGDHLPSSISKVYLPTMQEVARTRTCVMPHGSRVNPQGTRQYSTCMMDQLLVELDVGSGAVSRRFSVAPGMEGPATGGDSHHAHGASRVCSPTWAQPSADGAHVFVACNRGSEVLEVDVATWTLTRRFATGEAPYNLVPTPDGRYLLATLKNREAPALEVIDLAAGRSVATVSTSGVLPHGAVVSADSRYAFVSVEGVGSDPGRVDVIDLAGMRRVATVEVGPQAAGITMPGAH